MNPFLRPNPFTVRRAYSNKKQSPCKQESTMVYHSLNKPFKNSYFVTTKQEKKIENPFYKSNLGWDGQEYMGYKWMINCQDSFLDPVQKYQSTSVKKYQSTSIHKYQCNAVPSLVLKSVTNLSIDEGMKSLCKVGSMESRRRAMEASKVVNVSYNNINSIRNIVSESQYKYPSKNVIVTDDKLDHIIVRGVVFYKNQIIVE